MKTAWTSKGPLGKNIASVYPVLKKDCTCVDWDHYDRKGIKWYDITCEGSFIDHDGWKWVCTRPKGHTGLHIACSDDGELGHQFKRWEQ